MTRENLRDAFHNEQGINWQNSEGEPDIDYVMWLEDKLTVKKNQCQHPESAWIWSANNQSAYCGLCGDQMDIS